MTPLWELGGHSHWVWQAKFNPHHDSLLLSASSDALVNLWHVPSAVGESGGRVQGNSRGASQAKGYGKEAPNSKACTYDDHEDSVYGKLFAGNLQMGTRQCTYSSHVATIAHAPSCVQSSICLLAVCCVIINCWQQCCHTCTAAHSSAWSNNTQIAPH